MSRAELRERLGGNTSTVDTFTGCQTEFDPFLLDGAYFGVGVLINPPGQLPGTDPARRLHFARGTKSGPLYVSPNVLPDDPLWLRLAYMRYPLDSEGAKAFLESVVPHSPPRRVPDNPVEVFSQEPLRWTYEHQALAALYSQAKQSEAQIVRFFQWGQMKFAVRGGPQTLAGIWAQYQHLAISVLWAWGLPHERLQLLYCEMLAEEVEYIYRGTHRLVAELAHDGQADLHRRSAAIEIDRARFNRNGASTWRISESPPSVARLAGGLADVIGSGGGLLASCPHCRRLYWKPDARKLFCSPRCRNAYNRAETKRGKAGGRRAQEREENKLRPEDWH